MSVSKRACSTHDAAFVTYGIDDGTELITRTYYSLRDEVTRQVELTPRLIEELTRRFRSEFVSAASVPVVPEPVEAAIVDASSQVVHEYLDQDSVDLRYELVPAFYRTVANLYCEYRAHFPDDGVEISF